MPTSPRHLSSGSARPSQAGPPTPGHGTPEAPAKADEPTLREAQEIHGPVLLSYLTRLTGGDLHRAEDILQETLLRAWNNPAARGTDGRFSRAWLFTVARRITIDQVRAVQARAPEYSDDRIDDHARVEDRIEQLLDGQEVRAAVDALPERLRVTVVEMFFQERSVAEAADILGIPPGTVKSRTFYALKALHEALVERGFHVRQPVDLQAAAGPRHQARKKPREA